MDTSPGSFSGVNYFINKGSCVSDLVENFPIRDGRTIEPAKSSVKL